MGNFVVVFESPGDSPVYVCGAVEVTVVFIKSTRGSRKYICGAVEVTLLLSLSRLWQS